MATDTLPAASFQLVLQPSRLSFGMRSPVSVKTPRNWGSFLQAANNYFTDLLMWCRCPLWFMEWLVTATSLFPHVSPEKGRGRKALRLPSFQLCIYFAVSVSDPTFIERFCRSCSGLFFRGLWALPAIINNYTCLLSLSGWKFCCEGGGMLLACLLCLWWALFSDLTLRSMLSLVLYSSAGSKMLFEYVVKLLSR